MIQVESKGSFVATDKFLKAMTRGEIFSALEKYGQLGVRALQNATPVATGITASSWGYEVRRTGSSYVLEWTNSHVVNGQPIVIMLQMGHGTGTGGYVQGRDFINPALAPIFTKIADEVWKVVTSA